MDIDLVLSFIGAFAMAKAVLLAREEQVLKARLAAAFACSLGAAKVAMDPEVTFTHWLAAVSGLIGLAWLGLLWGAWLSRRKRSS